MVSFTLHQRKCFSLVKSGAVRFELLSSLWCRLYLDPKENPDFLIKALSFVATIAPKLRLKGLASATLCRDENVVDVYFNEPLHVVEPATLSLQHGIVQGMKAANARAGEIQLPVCLIHGTVDTLTPIKGSEDFVSALGSKDKTFHRFEGGYHELLNEPNYEEGALKDVCAWLKKRI